MSAVRYHITLEVPFQVTKETTKENLLKVLEPISQYILVTELYSVNQEDSVRVTSAYIGLTKHQKPTVEEAKDVISDAFVMSVKEQAEKHGLDFLGILEKGAEIYRDSQYIPVLGILLRFEEDQKLSDFISSITEVGV